MFFCCRASGSAEDVEGLKSQIEDVSNRLIEAQNHKLFLESKLQEKDKIIKTLQDNLANTLADMKHIRGETQKSMAKHEKRTREGWFVIFVLLSLSWSSVRVTA